MELLVWIYFTWKFITQNIWYLQMEKNLVQEREAVWLCTYSSLVEIVCVVERLGGGSNNGFSKLTSTENKTTWANDAHLSVSSTDHVYCMPCSINVQSVVILTHNTVCLVAKNVHSSILHILAVAHCIHYIMSQYNIFSQEHGPCATTVCQCTSISKHNVHSACGLYAKHRTELLTDSTMLYNRITMCNYTKYVILVQVWRTWRVKVEV